MYQKLLTLVLNLSLKMARHAWVTRKKYRLEQRFGYMPLKGGKSNIVALVATTTAISRIASKARLISESLDHSVLICTALRTIL
ncbi:unnamed protein product, partial [Nesidiocoris tenuis]